MKFNILFLLVLVSTVAFSENRKVLNLEQNTTFTFVEEYLIINDKDSSLNINSIRTLNENVFQSAESFSDYNERVWLKFTLKNTIPETVKWVLWLGRASNITVYIENEENELTKIKSGYALPAKKHKIWQNSARISTIPIFLPGNENFTFYILFEDNCNRQIMPVLEFVSKEKFDTHQAEINLTQGFFWGIIFIMVFYHLFVYKSVRDKSYLYYILYMIAILITFLHPFSFSWKIFYGHLGFLADYFYLLSQMLPLMAFILFAQSFVNTSKYTPKVHKAFNIINSVLFVSILVASIVYYFTQDIMNGFNILNLVLIVSFLSIIVLSVIIYKINLPAKYFVYGTLTLIVFATIGVSMLFDIQQWNHTPQYIIQTGVVGQMLVFAFGLGRKIKITEEERAEAQQNLIEQLKENQKLQTKVNRELEQKVKERTKVIEDQKQDLEQQHNQLQQANVELEEIHEEVVAHKAQLEKSHREITDSINYAGRIQQALLPQKEVVEEFLQNYFVVYRPCKIVSGDFYFIRKKEEKVIIIAADCTGHGVPGAFMSMLGITLLNEIVNRPNKVTSAEILEELRTEVKTSLRQTGKRGEQQDGMDMAVCTLDTKTNSLNFAGAYNPFWLYRKNNKKTETEIIELKANRQPVGVYLKEKPFDDKFINLQQGDMFYIFSDGFHSQFGGKHKRTYKSTKFRKFLSSIYSKTLDEQKQVIENEFDWWKKDYNQVDDIVVLGVRV